MKAIYLSLFLLPCMHAIKAVNGEHQNNGDLDHRAEVMKKMDATILLHSFKHQLDLLKKQEVITPEQHRSKSEELRQKKLHELAPLFNEIKELSQDLVDNQ
ncbi:MAG: hypothetical protein WD055_06065 [Candidatus Dependentiae bacterium]